ncbi:MAG TPA: M67 family metallopeptidase [Rhizomicrobium sp.]|nr:M67 family metallopeptidase [Rhizomicrobium sp.]
MRLVLPHGMRRQFEREARAALPRECCGLIEGRREGARIEAVALHPARNLAAASRRFEIDPSDHIRIRRGARRRGHAIVGCYHSHPDGMAEPSALDRAGAGEDDFVWLILAAGRETVCLLAAFVFKNSDFHPIEIA